jgi:hypothetical protein
MDDYAKQPREQRLQRLTRTADELASALMGAVLVYLRPAWRRTSNRPVMSQSDDAHERGTTADAI